MARTTNTKRIKRVIQFIEQLTVPSGKGEGHPLKLRPFEKKFIKAIYGPMTVTGERRTRRAILSMARKNGKSLMTATLALTHLVGPESIKNGEIYSAANDREQASIIFRYACQVVRSDQELSSLVRIVDSTKTMIFMENGSVYRAVSAEVGTKFGLNPSVVIYDELAQSKSRDLYDALDTSMAARAEPLFIVISTQSNDPKHILSELIDDGLAGHDPSVICHLYAVPDDADDEKIFTDQKLWKMANPALGDFRSLEEMRNAAKRARRLGSFESAFRNLYLNQRVDAQSPLIPRMEWLGCHDPNAGIKEGEKVYLGLDLSAKTDLTALVAVTAAPNRDSIKAWFWKPEELIRDHENRDRVPYWSWVQSGYIQACPGRAIDYDWVLEQLIKVCREFDVVGMAYDRWRIEDLLNSAERAGFPCYVEKKDKNGRSIVEQGALRMVPWGQGYKDMAEPVDVLEVSILERKLKHDGNPVLTWNVSNAVTISDPAGNRKLDKSKTRFRIDGVVALTMALGLKSRDLANDDGPSVYETRGLQII